ncbi:MAG TPA: amidohydrolase family protein [Thermoanaerobaculia bacterium]|nr:amidohydrolase family protein [Thermoanaerobaculia bacterium]
MRLLLVLLLTVPLSAQTLAIRNVTVLDGKGGQPLREVNVLIRDGRIVSVDRTAVPAGATVVDGRGKFLIPGLWDMHVHLSWTTASALPVLLANGVTSVRDLGSALPELDAWRTRIEDGTLAGPRIERVGPILNGQSFNKYQLVTGNPDQTRGVARALKFAGVDALKTHRRMERESYFALVDEGKKLGLPVVGHIPMTVMPAEASSAGQQTIEHVATLFEGTFHQLVTGSLGDAIRAWRGKGAAELFATFVKNGTVFDPTLVAYHRVLHPGDPAELRYVAASLRKEFAERKPLTPEQLAEWKNAYDEYGAVVKMAADAGVTIVTGSDIAAERVPGFTLHDELELLVAAGLTPLQALRAATVNSAAVANEVAAIEPGTRADLVLLDADPLADIRNTRKIHAVIARGKLYPRADLDRLLAEGEALAAAR